MFNFKTLSIILILTLTGCVNTQEAVHSYDVTNNYHFIFTVTSSAEAPKAITEPNVETKTVTRWLTKYQDCTPSKLKGLTISAVEIDKEIYRASKDVKGYVKALEDRQKLLASIVASYNKEKGNCNVQ